MMVAVRVEVYVRFYVTNPGSSYLIAIDEMYDRNVRPVSRMPAESDTQPTVVLVCLTV